MHLRVGEDGEAGQQRSGVVSQESIEAFAKIAEVQASVTRPLEARQASTGRKEVPLVSIKRKLTLD